MRFIILILLCALPAHAGMSSSIAPGLLSTMHFNEGAGTISWDSTIKQNCTLTGSMAWVTGKYGSAFYNNRTGFFTCANPLTASPAEFSTGLWLWSDTTNINYNILVQWWAKLGAFTLRTNTGDVMMAYYGGTGGGGIALSTTQMGTSKWIFVVATLNTGSGGRLKIYVNGVLEGNVANTGTMTDPGGSSHYFGAYWNGLYGYKGIIDEVFGYTRELSAGEVKKLYLDSVGRHGNAQ